MKNKMSRIVALMVVLILVAGLFISGCAGEATPKTLKIGVIAWLGFPLGLDLANGVKVAADLVNADGGLEIGGDKYTIEVIVYDSEFDQAKAASAANRLVYEDGVQFILGDPIFVDAYLPITEAEKVVVIASPATPAILSPDNHYSFLGAYMNCGQAVLGTWFTEAYPEYETVMVALPDNVEGHTYAETNKKVLEAGGMTVTDEFYPADATDLSALGTKVKNENPDVFIALAGGPVGDSLAYKAVWTAGYRGKLFGMTTQPAGILAMALPAEALEGFIGGAFPTEFDPALTQVAKDFKAAWIAKFGAWEDPEITCLSTWSCLIAALQEADSLDPDEVAEVIGNGLQFEGPTGPSQMVSRPDLGNDRTVDCVVGYYIKKVVDGKPTVIDTIDLDDAVQYFLSLLD